MGLMQATSFKKGADYFCLPAAGVETSGDSDLLTQCPVVSEYLQRARKQGLKSMVAAEHGKCSSDEAEVDRMEKE